MDVENLISGSSAFLKSSLHIWKFSVPILLKPILKDFEYYLASMWNECNCVEEWRFFRIALLWDKKENWPFPVLWPLLSFPNLLAYWVHHFIYLFIYFCSYFFHLFFISWRLVTLQYCSGLCHTLTLISHGFTCIPHPDPPSHLPLHPLPLGLPSAPGPSTCLMHPAWAGDLFHPW